MRSVRCDEKRSSQILQMNKENEEVKTKEKENYECKLCKSDLEKILSYQSSVKIPMGHQKALMSPGNESKLYSISENIFGLVCLARPTEHNIQQEHIFNALEKIKECFKNSNIKLYCLADVCPEALKLCDTSVTFIMDLSKPPRLKSILIFCESVFDWLAKANNNRILVYAQESVSVIILMTYAYSCFYDALLHRDMRLSVALRSFITANSKLLEKVPVSFRRYGGYMSLYSCMNQLQSLRSFVYLYCLIIYSYPSMEPDKDKTTQLFFKIYTNDPLSCCHTTKLYCLPASANRLVILFDQFPISLHNDSMIVCYHRSPSLLKRTKLFRLNFHTCQAISDMLTFHCQDFEDIYPGCSLKMKMDLFFRETAIFDQEQCKYIVETSHSELSHVERCDSYTSLDENESPHKAASSVTINSPRLNPIDKTDSKVSKAKAHRDSTSITVYKTSVGDHRDKKNKKQSIEFSKDINQSGRISGPIDSYHSTKLDTVRTSSSILNGSGSNNEYKVTNPNFHTQSSTGIDREKCNQQLDTLMKDLNLENVISPNISRFKASTFLSYEDKYKEPSNQKTSSNTSSREIQLMAELLEAQKEISNLRRSMNHLDITDQVARNPINNNSYSSSRFKGVEKGSVGTSIPDGYHYNTSRINNWTSNQADFNKYDVNDSKTTPRLNSSVTSSFNAGYNSGRDFNDSRPPGYSVHRENMERERMMKEKYLTSEKMIQQNFHNEKDVSDVFEEVETINLQPIGKGIQNLTMGNNQPKMPLRASKVESTSHLFTDNLGSMSPLSTRQNFSMSRLNSNISPLPTSNGMPLYDSPLCVTLQVVDEKIQNWYQPQITRDEAIAILKNSSPGHFIIRDSNTYSGAYGLALKVATIPQNITLKSDDLESEKVRHYLIEAVGSQGVCFKGFPDEPVFPSLSHLVQYYCHTSSVLPCLLILPNKIPTQNDIVKVNKSNTSNQHITITSPKLSLSRKVDIDVSGYSVYYLGCYDVEYITGPSVINKAVERLLEHLDARRFTECQMRINPNEGIVLTDIERKLFFKRHHPFSAITYCATDPRDRKIELDMCKSKGIKKTKIFGIIVKAYIAGENKCFLFGELDPQHKANAIVKLINDCIKQSTDN